MTVSEANTADRANPAKTLSECQQQQQLQLWQQEQLSCSRSLQDVLVTPLRVVYGYSLAGRGLLQLLRGLPPYPDWVRGAAAALALDVAVAVAYRACSCVLCAWGSGSAA